MNNILEMDKCEGKLSCACGEPLENHVVTDECMEIMFDAIEQAASL